MPIQERNKLLSVVFPDLFICKQLVQEGNRDQEGSCSQHVDDSIECQYTCCYSSANDHASDNKYNCCDGSNFFC